MSETNEVSVLSSVIDLSFKHFHWLSDGSEALALYLEMFG